MTENEAIEELKLIKHTRIFIPSDEVWEMAIKALEEKTMLNEIMHELSEYQAIGTVEEIQEVMALCKSLQETTCKYMDIGTIEEFKALKEKNTKKRFNIFESHGMRQFVCGCCDRPILTTDNYCSFCGQKLDWQ
jgi:hypothetical protein